MKWFSWGVMVQNVDVCHGQGEDEESQDLEAGLGPDLEAGWAALPSLNGVCTVHADGQLIPLSRQGLCSQGCHYH